MLKDGVIEESSSPWLAPTVFVRKKIDDIRICVDYWEINKRTVKDAYPLPRPDEVQDRLAGSVIFSTLDLQSGYWQLPVHVNDRANTAFCPGPGLGLFQFRKMPFVTWSDKTSLIAQKHTCSLNLVYLQLHMS